MNNLLALVTVSEVYLMDKNCKDDVGGVAAAAGSLINNTVNITSTASVGDIPAKITDLAAAKSGSPAEGGMPSLLPWLKENAAPSHCETATAAAVAVASSRDPQGISSVSMAYCAPEKGSGVQSLTKQIVAQKLPRKHSKQFSYQRVHQSQQQQESSDFIKKKNQPSFPVILMAIMSGSHNSEYITFLSDEQRFIIIDSVSLETKVLPLHFEENVPTYDQFLQLLHLWGFEVLKDPNYTFVKVFKHPMFRKGDWEGCLKIRAPDPNAWNAKADEVTTTTRSVTPPKASSSADLFGRLAAGQTEAVLPNSSLGLLLSSLAPANNFVNRRVTYDPTPDEATAAFQQKLRESLLSGRNQGRMGNFELQTLGRSCSMPMLHRRASHDMNMRVSEHFQWNGNVCPPINYRRPSLGDTGDMSSVSIKSQRQQMNGDRIAFPSSATPSDADVLSATQDIVSAAIDALRPKRRRLSIDHLPSSGSSVCLDVMTEIFLERSRKVLSSRPVSIMGPMSKTMLTSANNNKMMNTTSV